MRVILILLIIILLAVPVNASELEAPTVPDSGKTFMPKETETFSEGVWEILVEATKHIKPAFAEAAGLCSTVIVSIILCSIIKSFPGSPSKVVEFVNTVFIAYLLLKPSNTMIHLGTTTITELSNYGKLLFPVLTAALAANGGITKSAALYTGAVALDSVLCAVISSIVVPAVYIFLTLSIVSGATGEKRFDKMKKHIKDFITWGLKKVLYIFTAFLGITGVVSGSADAAAVKATKMAISGVVPVVGSMLSSASETVLVGAGVIKNSVGVYGLLAILSVWIGPFIKIGVQYILLALTNAVCDVFSNDRSSKLIEDFTSAMGMLLGMTGTVCVFLLVSIVCFLKGVA